MLLPFRFASIVDYPWGGGAFFMSGRFLGFGRSVVRDLVGFLSAVTGPLWGRGGGGRGECISPQICGGEMKSL